MTARRVLAFVFELAMLAASLRGAGCSTRRARRYWSTRSHPAA